MKTSEHIRDFLSFIRASEARYTAAVEAMEKENKRTQDFLHAIEFEPHAEQRSKIATQMRASRITRRENKDAVEELEPLIDFLSVQANRKAMDQLAQILGRIRKVEKYHADRSYHTRVQE